MSLPKIDFNAVSPTTYKLLIVVATIIWGSAFVVMKDALNTFEPAWLIGIRFTAAGIILLIIFRRRVMRVFSLKVLGMGMLLGLFDFLAFLTQTIGLQYTTPGINAFLTATYCVIVPFVWWVVARRRPTLLNIGAATVALAGIWLVSVSSSEGSLSLGLGEGLTLICAVMFAIHIVFTSKFSRITDVLVLTTLQFLTEGLCGLGMGACFEATPMLSALTPTIILQLAFLVLFASIFCFGVQNIALAHVHPAQAALLLSLESVFGVIFSILLYGEVLTARLLVGFAIIFIAIAANETLPSLSSKLSEKRCIKRPKI